MTNPSKQPLTKSVQITGAGISGLLCAYYAVEKGLEVDVYDTAPGPGGKIHTLKSQHGLMETAANAILVDAVVEEVAQKIGLELFEKKPAARKRFIYRLGQITRWPLSVLDSFWLARFFVLWKMNSASVHPRAHETLKVWSDRELSPAISESLLGPACQGIFGVDASSLSAKLIFNYFFSKKPRAYGRLRGSVAPQKGMEQWIHFLMAYLKSKNVRFHFANTTSVNSNQIHIVATDVKNAAQILKSCGDSRSAILSKVPCVDLVSVTVFYTQRPEHQKAGFGVLFSRSENLEPLGVLFNDDIFFQRSENGHSETWIFGSAASHSSAKGYSQQADEFFQSAIRASRHKLWNDSTEAKEYNIHRWPEAIPLYGLELEEALKGLDQESPQGGVYLMGNYLGEIGLNRLFHGAKSLLDRIENDLM